MAKKGERHWDKASKAKAILECAVPGSDATVCKKYGITPRTLQRWHQEFREGTDAELTASVAEKKAILDQGWASKIPSALSACLDYIARAAKAARLDDPDMLHAVSGALKMIAETDGTYKMIDARVSGQDRANGTQDRQVHAGANVTPIRRAV